MLWRLTCRGAAAGTVWAHFIASDAELSATPEGGVLKCEFESDVETLAVTRPERGRLSESASEESLEDLSQTAKTKVSEYTGAITGAGMPEQIIFAACSRVTETLIRLIDLLEPLFRIRCTVAVGMVLKGKSAKGLSDLLTVCVASYAENLVIVSLDLHHMFSKPQIVRTFGAL